MRFPILEILLLTCLFFVPQVFAKNACGTSRLIQNIKQHGDSPAQRKTALRRFITPCPPESFYDTVLSRKTEHFQIFYTLTGPNQTTEEYIDTVAKYAEFAYDFHTRQLGLLPPLGTKDAFHYQQDVDTGLYPIEIIDIDQMRGTQYYLGGKCHGCYGITLPGDDEQSELLLDNDFRYTPEYKATSDTIVVDGKKCAYDIADQELYNTAHNYSYANQWDAGIRVTTLHEIYHAVQMRYLDMTGYWTFWFEASASGVEELAAPDIDDYFSYLPTMSKSVGTALDMMVEDYGAGIFLLYLYNHLDKKSEKFIWESFAKNPNDDFIAHLGKLVQKKNLNLDSVFHDFATKLAFSGNRSNFIDSTEWIASDEKDWPEFKHQVVQSDARITPALQNFSYQYYAYGHPNLENFVGKASVAAYQNNTVEIYPLKTSNQGDSIYTVLKTQPAVDSILWIFSRISSDTLKTIVKDSSFKAYPVPWRHGDLCFTPLPRNKKFIEIRNRRGDLITREKYSTITHCISEEQVKKLMVPGTYRFRAGNSGKTTDFIVIY